MQVQAQEHIHYLKSLSHTHSPKIYTVRCIHDIFVLQKQTLNSQLPFLMLVAEIKANWAVNWADGAGVYDLHLHYGLPSTSTQGSLVTTWLHHISPKY